MKYVKKLPQTDKELSAQLQNEGWKKMWEPRSLALAVLLSLPLSLLLSGLTLWLAYLLKPSLFAGISSGTFELSLAIDFKMLLLIAAIFAYLFIHEMIHAVCIPNFAKSEKTVWGLNGLFGFVSTTEPIRKGRFLLVSVMPFLLLSVAPLYLLHLVGFLNWYTLGLCLINAAGSCVDFLNILLIVFQIKRGQTIINNGFETYHK